MNLPGKMVCGESNQIYVEKILSCSTTEKKCLLLIRSEKTVKLGVEKKVSSQKPIAPPPRYQMVRPLEIKNYVKIGYRFLVAW